MGTRQYNERITKLITEGPGKNYPSSDFLKLEDTAPGFMRGTKGYTSNELESALKKSDAKEMDEIQSRAAEASDESKGFLSKVLPTYKAGANKDFNKAVADFKKIPQEVRDEAAYDQSGHKKGGRISAKYMSFSKTGKPAGMKPVTKMARGGGIEQRGKTKGRFV